LQTSDKSRRTFLPTFRDPAASLLLTWKFLGLRSLTTDSATVEWARDWIRLDMTRSYSILERVAAPRSLPPDFLYYAGLPIQIAVFLGALTAGTLAVWIALRLRRQTDSVQVSLVIIGVLAVLYTASIGEFLPYWMGLYPGRVLAFMLLPAAFALTEAFVFLASRRRLAISAAALSMAFLGVAWGRMGPNGDANLGAIGFDGLIRTYTESVNARVTEDDLAVMKWITENLAADAVIANNQGDGGHLIPAVCHRKILAPHYQAFWYRGEMARWAASTRPGYLFIGAAPSPAFGRDYEAAELDGRSDLEVLFQRGDARLYRWRERPVDGQPRGRPATSPLSPPR